MDETKNPKDTSQTGDSSVGTKGTPEPPKIHNEESEKKAVSDALSAAGRDAKTIAERDAESKRILEAAQTTQAELHADRKRWQDERDEADREAVIHDPVALKSHEERIRQRNKDADQAKREQDLDDKEKKHQGNLDRIRVFDRTQLAAEIAVEKGVSLDSILKLTTEDSREAMEATADMLPKTADAKPPLKTDSGTTLGGSASFEQIRDEMIKNPSNDAKMQRYLDAKKERDAQK